MYNVNKAKENMVHLEENYKSSNWLKSKIQSKENVMR